MRPTTEQIWQWLDQIPDPEIPVISIVDLGIVREVNWNDHVLEIALTPTYSGCPATRVIAADVEVALQHHGIDEIQLKTRLSPAWTTDWLSDKARKKLEHYGIAPPQATGTPASCPHCGDNSVTRISQFGSTPCKAQWRCNECLEPFDYFKCI
ncbi:MAG: 1,2-phenylacetyl-CoA epoxidase subunit PaaD [Granulosicoccus sp.]